MPETNMKVEYNPRPSGKTSRMVDLAIKLSKEGRAVYIIAPYSSHARNIKTMIEMKTKDDNHGIKIEVGPPRNFDWEEMRLRGAHPNCRVLVDHHAIERQFPRMLAEYHAYDFPAVWEKESK